MLSRLARRKATNRENAEKSSCEERIHEDDGEASHDGLHGGLVVVDLVVQQAEDSCHHDRAAYVGLEELLRARSQQELAPQQRLELGAERRVVLAAARRAVVGCNCRKVVVLLCRQTGAGSVETAMVRRSAGDTTH